MIGMDDWEKAFGDYDIYDCAIRNKSAFSFLCIRHTEGVVKAEPNKRIVNLFTDSGRIGYAEFSGFSRPLLTVARQPLEQAVMISAHGDVAVLGGGEKGMKEAIPMGRAETPLFTSAQAMTTINGLVYLAGAWRCICRRTSTGAWENLADRTTLPVPERNKHGSNQDGFDAIDGFNDRDIYCGGGKGDVWRFDGARWHRCPVDTTMYIETICCAGDGYVYIGMQSGSVLRGREDTWELLHEGTLSLPFTDMVWFEGQLWCTSDYGLWTIKDGKMAEADVPSNVRSCSGNLAVGDGVMLLAGMYGACVFNGKTWKELGPDR